MRNILSSAPNFRISLQPKHMPSLFYGCCPGYHMGRSFDQFGKQLQNRQIFYRQNKATLKAETFANRNFRVSKKTRNLLLKYDSFAETVSSKIPNKFTSGLVILNDIKMRNTVHYAPLRNNHVCQYEMLHNV